MTHMSTLPKISLPFDPGLRHPFARTSTLDLNNSRALSCQCQASVAYVDKIPRSCLNTRHVAGLMRSCESPGGTNLRERVERGRQIRIREFPSLSHVPIQVKGKLP